MGHPTATGMRGHVGRREIIEALEECRTYEDAADALGYCDGAALRKRMRSLGLRRRRTCDGVLVVEAQP